MPQPKSLTVTKETTIKGVILAAGFGTRMAALTSVVPKPMLPVANTPMLEWIILSMKAAGIREVLIITGYKAGVIEVYFGDGARWGMAITYAQQTEVSGTGSATRIAKHFANGHPVMVTYGDILLDRHEYAAVASMFRDNRCVAASALNRMEDVSKGSAVYLDGYVIVKMIEKPPPGASGTNLNNAGVYLFAPAIFDAIDRTPKSERGEYELTQAVQTLITDGHTVMGRVIDGVQYDIGAPEAYLETNCAWMNTVSSGAPIHAATQDNFASPHVVLEPPVLIGGDCEIERCRLGPEVCIGAGARIGHSVTIRRSVVLPGADIGDGASLFSAVIGHDAGVSNRAVVHGSRDSVCVVGDGENQE